MRQLKIIRKITNRETKSLDKYLSEIGKVDLLTHDQEVDLAVRIHSGDQIAIQKLTRANLRFVVSVAKQYQNYGLSLGDLINEGNVGLIRAASLFDEKRGFKFISYAVWWIRQTILLALGEQSRLVRVPLNRVNAFNRLQKVISELEQKFLREPSIEEVSETLKVPSQEVVLLANLQERHDSLDAPLGRNEGGSLLDMLPNSEPSPEAELLNDSLRNEIARSLETLTASESNVISYFYGLAGRQSLTLEEIGEKLDITTERVRQIKEKATRRLRHPMRSMALRTYL